MSVYEWKILPVMFNFRRPFFAKMTKAEVEKKYKDAVKTKKNTG